MLSSPSIIMTRNNDGGFIDFLPYDIVSAIFSYLSQDECLKCLDVCGTWYTRIPEYTKSVWQTLKINRCFQNMMIDKYRARFFGDHIKHVQISNFDKKNDGEFFTVVKQLLFDYGCNKIENLEIINFYAPDQNKFVENTLKPLASTLTHLTMNGHHSDAAFLQILSACPKLTHFTYISPLNHRLRKNAYNSDPFVLDSAQSSSSSPPPTTASAATATTAIKECFNNMTYLHMDVPLEKRLRLQPILQRCPNLQYYIGMSLENYDSNSNHRIHYRNDLIATDEILSWCPKLVCFKSNGSYDRNISKDSMLQSITNSNKNIGNSTSKNHYGLQHLSLRENLSHDQIAPFLTNNSDTIQYLELIGSGYDPHYFGWNSLFSSPFLHMVQLRTLICDSIVFNSVSLVALLNQAPSIHSLILKRVEQLTIDHVSVKMLHTLPCLRYLHIVSIMFRDEFAPVLLLERLPALEKLIAYESVFTLKKMTDFSCLQQLKYLELDTVEWEYEEIEDMEQNNYNSNSDVDTGDMMPRIILPVFFENLGLSAHSKGPCLETIELVDTYGITLKHLIAMADIPTVKHIIVDLAELMGEENEEESLLFITKLQANTAIERLTLRNIAYLPPYSVIEALSNLSFLKELYLQSPTRSLPSASVLDELIDVSRILPLLSNNLLEKITLENAIGNRVRPLIAIEDMVSSYGLIWYSKPCFTRINDDGLYLEDIILERQ